MGSIKLAAGRFRQLSNRLMSRLEVLVSRFSGGFTLSVLFKVVAAALAFTPFAAFADITGSGTGLEWEGPLETITNSLKGPVAFSISLLGMIATGVALIFGGEINDFIRRLIMLVLVISLIAFAGSILSTLFGSSEIMQITEPVVVQ